MKLRLARLVAAAAVPLLCACQADYRFHTVAVYAAPAGGYTVRIEGRGVVKAGDDLSRQASGLLNVSPGEASSSTPAPVKATLTLRESQVIVGNDVTGGLSVDDHGRLAVTNLLSAAGYALEEDELDELLSLIGGVLAGPKGTHMEGQTRLFKVLSVRFDRR